MQKLPCLVVAASAAALVLLPAGVALAQGAPSDGTAPAATSTAAPETKAPEKHGFCTGEGGAEEKETGQDDPAAGDRPFGRPWHGAHALPELGAERVSSVYSVR